MKSRIIMHVDLDAFFASVEEREHPEYKGKSVVVGANPKGGKGRGVVSTANYEARKYGIHSGMPISRAYRLCPDAIYLPVRHELYEKISDEIMEMLREHADKFEQVSIDEAFLDVSERARNFERAKNLAILIKEKIKEKEGLTCSVGIAPNKLIAKIASDFKKPDGLTVVKPEEVKKFLSPLPVEKLWGIGKKTKARLNKLGIKTIGELAKFPVHKLIEEFGELGYEYHLMANGMDESEVEEKYEIKSIGREHTFEEDTNDLKWIHDTLNSLVSEIVQEVKEKKFLFRTVTIKVRYEDFETHTHSKSLLAPTDDFKTLLKISEELLKPFLLSEKSIRLIGVRVSNLTEIKRLTKLA